MSAYLWCKNDSIGFLGFVLYGRAVCEDTKHHTYRMNKMLRPEVHKEKMSQSDKNEAPPPPTILG